MDRLADQDRGRHHQRYVINTSNYNDFVILNGGIRYDDYNIKASGFGTKNGVPNVFNAQEQHYGMPNFNLGVV